MEAVEYCYAGKMTHSAAKGTTLALACIGRGTGQTGVLSRLERNIFDNTEALNARSRAREVSSISAVELQHHRVFQQFPKWELQICCSRQDRTQSQTEEEMGVGVASVVTPAATCRLAEMYQYLASAVR